MEGVFVYGNPWIYIYRKEKEMLYLKNITDSQELMIPRDVQTSARTFSLLIQSTIDKTAISLDVEDDQSSDHYYKISVSLPAGMTDGEHEYSLLENGLIRSHGLLILGESERPTEYNKMISYEQYIRD